MAQNVFADKAHLPRIQNSSQLKQFEREKILVSTSHIKGVVDSRIKPEYRYLRPNAARFLAQFASVHLQNYHRSLVLTSAVRPIDYQQSLRKRNGNAAKSSGPLQSSHPTGETFDVSKRVMVPAEQAWARSYLLKKKVAGRIIPEEEMVQPCFHIMVLPSVKTAHHVSPHHPHHA
jgi:hypothetical protein